MRHSFTRSLQVSRCWQITVCVPCLVGFASATDRKCVEAVLRSGVRSGLYPSQQTANGIVDSADDKLFELVLQSDDRHVLHELLTDRVDISYNLRSRSRDRVLPEKKGHLTELSH